MWLFTRYGFYSVACAHKADGTIDADTVMIRARRKAHLKLLQERFPEIAVEIVTTPDRDYRHRIVVPKSVWSNVMAQLADEQNWSNFKNEAARFQGKAGADYVHALHQVWSIMYRTQQAEESRHPGDRR